MPMFIVPGKPAALAALALSALALAACGESSEEKAAKSVCSSVAEVRTQLTKLQGLSISTNFPTEAKTSFEAIGTSIGKIKESAPKLETARKEEVEAANRNFALETATITASVVSATKSGNLETGLKSVEGQIKGSLEKLSNDYKKAFEQLKCS
jgi:hypothetical protein